ncbi:chemokine (C-C motif) ligand 20 precursor [Esox lucius]|uniref:C-C motif chemokine 20 n=1 Tax=Esox lucius TaxID=8010 RepID=C1BY02_ESOLU|nr:chemokine (C-C motif) ligand 20 precursor [Esox lucius]ACO13905.1 C-C motif chemokine 20 precursor [Esox lucius]
MAPRYLNVILLLCSLVTMFCQGTREIYPRKLYCCVEYQQQPIPIQNIKGYKMQSSTEVCHIDAIIFYTIKNYKVCANIKDNWVKQALDHLSKKLKKLSSENSVMENPLPSNHKADLKPYTRSHTID